MKTILVTGGLGYLGGRLTSFFQDQGYYLKVGTRQVLDSPQWLTNGCVVNMDFGSEGSLLAACQDVDIIIHLAALNHMDCAANPELALQVNTLGTLRLLRAAECSGVEQFVYFSTAHVYGSPLEGKISEHSLTRPIHSYALTHKFAEDYVLAERAKKSLKSMVIRLSNSFGSPMSTQVNCWSLLVNDLCKQAVETRHLKLNSAGLQRRDFVAISDVQRAVLHLLKLTNDELGDGLFNLGGQWSPRVIEMVLLIQKRCGAVLGYEPDIICPPVTKVEEDSLLVYDVDKLLATGFSLKKDIENEIDKLLLFCQQEFFK